MPADTERRRVPQWLIPIAAGVLAFLLRLLGIGWGLPNELHHQSYHPDEYLLLVYAVGSLDLPHGVWNPGFYNYGSLWLYVMHLVSVFLTGWGLAPEGSVAVIQLGCRVVSAGMGAATVSLCYLIGARVWRPAAGITAALLLLVAPGHVVHSRFHTVDVPATFFVACAMLLAVKVLQEEEFRRAARFALWGCAIAGLAAAVKYNMVLVLLCPLLALMLRSMPRQRKAMYAVLGLISCVVAFLVTTPGAILASEQFLRDVLFEMRHVKEGHGLVFASTAPGWVYHLGNMVEAFGLVVPAMALVGLVLAIRQKRTAVWVLLAFAVPYYVLIGSVEVKFLRYVLPLGPPLCVLAGCAVAAGMRESLLASRPAAVAAAVLVFGATFGNNAAVVTELMLREDPRDAAARWLATNAKGASIGFPTPPWYYTPPLFPETGAGFGEAGARYRLQRMEEVTEYRLLYYLGEGGTLTEWDPRLITALHPEYVVYSSFEYVDAERVRLPGFVDTTALLKERYEVVKSLGYRGQMSHDMQYISPHIVIWKRKTP